MTRSEDPPGKVKHVRFGKISDDILTHLTTFPGVRAIVLHKSGKTGEHPHYHIWWETDLPVTNQTFRNRLKAHHDVFKSFNGQRDWSFRNHDSWSAWANYVTSNLSHEVLLDYQDLKAVSDSKSVIGLVVAELPSGAGTTAHEAVKYTIQKPKKSVAMKDKFLQYAINELHWERDSFPMSDLNYWVNKVGRAANRYFHNGLPSLQMAVVIEHAVYEFGNDDVKDHIDENIVPFLRDRKILRI